MTINEYELIISVFRNCMEITKNSIGSYYKSLESNEDLKDFNFLDMDTENSNTNFHLQVSKDLWVNNEFYERKVA